MAELFGVAGNGYGEVSGSGPANGRRARYGRIRFRGEWVENRVQVWGFLAVEPRELTACVEDHGNLLWGRAYGKLDC